MARLRLLTTIEFPTTKDTPTAMVAAKIATLRGGQRVAPISPPTQDEVAVLAEAWTLLVEHYFPAKRDPYVTPKTQSD